MFPSKRKNFALLFWIQVLTYLSFSIASSVSTNAYEENTDDDDELVQFVNLQDLNNTELENICTSRGFELIPEVDPNTGETLEFTHDDYVEAAQQCLDVEAEMEKMFKHNPSILDDLEKERNRMEATKAELEAQILAKQTEMEEKRREHHERQQNHMNSTFLPHDDSGVKVVDNEAIDVETDFANDIPGDIADSVSDEDSTTKTEEERENAPKSSLKRTKIQQIPSNSTATINRGNENPLSLKVILRETIQELRMRITRDFRIVSTFVFPPWAREAVLRKIIFPLAKLTRATGESALDMMKRYLKVVLEDLRKAQQQQKQERQQKEA